MKHYINKNVRHYTALLSIAIILSACTVYKSPDRKAFESDYASFKVQNLTVNSKEPACSYESVRGSADASKLVTIIKLTSDDNESVFLWEYQLNGRSVFETDNLKGTYCIYENI
ncbi:MAG: hypothetical protein AABY53_03015 [Bdellovibrionota bacterium]